MTDNQQSTDDRVFECQCGGRQFEYEAREGWGVLICSQCGSRMEGVAHKQIGAGAGDA
jgi:ribosomal protein L37AE/L43A